VARLGGTSGSTKVSTKEEAKKSSSSSVSSKLAKAQKSYLKTLAPSKDEEKALKANNELVTGFDKEAAKIQQVQGNQGNNVAGVFQERQLDRLSTDTDAKQIPLKNQIAALQSARQAKSKVAAQRLNLANKGASAKSANPLDEEYKRIRNEKALIQLGKAQKKGGTGGGGGGEKTLAQSNAEYNRIKADAAQRGFVTLPKGVSGPPTPKVLVEKKKRGGRTLPGV
jgi:hypothetical protein